MCNNKQIQSRQKLTTNYKLEITKKLNSKLRLAITIFISFQMNSLSLRFQFQHWKGFTRAVHPLNNKVFTRGGVQKTSHIPRGWHEQRSSPETTNSNDRRARRVQCFERVLRHRSHLVFFSLSVGSSLPENQNKNKSRSVACTQVTIPAPFNIGRSIKSRATVPQQTTQTGSSSNNNRSRAQVFVGLHDDDDEPPSHLIAPLGRLAFDSLRRSTTSIKKAEEIE